MPADATLGVYNVIIKSQGFGQPCSNYGQPLGGGTFRVEEYKKPEFEVTVDAPADPVMLGEKIEGKITAKYYFGSPVTKAKVKYKNPAGARLFEPTGTRSGVPWDPRSTSRRHLGSPAITNWSHPGRRDWDGKRPIPSGGRRRQESAARRAQVCQWSRVAPTMAC